MIKKSDMKKRKKNYVTKQHKNSTDVKKVKKPKHRKNKKVST